MGISSLCEAQLAVHYISQNEGFCAVAATIAAAEASHYGAGYATGYGYAGWAGPQGLGAAPLGLRVHPNGAVTPNDKPAVAAAKADHFAAGGGRSLGPIAYAAAPAITAPAAIAGGYGYARGYGWAGPQGLGAAPLGLRVHPNGAVTPNDEPAVAAAKADHFAAGGGRSLGPIA